MDLQLVDRSANIMNAIPSSKISSNSWGSSDFTYNYFTLHLDDIIYHNPEHLFVFAAGNDGQNGPFSLGSPSCM
jgi:hypothetical protein